MIRLFLSFLVFTSIVFSTNQNDVPKAQIDASDIFQNTSKKLVSISSPQKMPSILDNYAYVVQQMTLQEKECQQIYQMSLVQKKYLLSHSYDQIVDKLLAQKYLTDEQIWFLWREYKNKRKWDWSNEKVYTENDLKDGLAKRKRDRQVDSLVKNPKQEQTDEKRKSDERKKIEQQKLLQKYDSKILQNSSWHSGLDLESSFISSYQQQREQALYQTISDGGKQQIKTHDIDLKTKAFMQTQDIDHRQFESLSGTIFSHQLFCECADHYKKAAKAFFEYGLKNSIIIPHLLEFTKAAFIGTQHEQFALAVLLSDAAEVLADISVGVSKGVISYACNIIDLARNPKQIAVAAKHLVASLLRVTQTLGAALATYDQEGFVGVDLQACKQSFGDDMILFNQMCDLSREHFHEWYQKSSTQDKAQAVSEIIMDGIITPFILGKGMKACGGTLLRAKESVNFARAVELAEELGLSFQEAEELLLATEIGVQQLPASVAELETALTSLMESEINVAIKGLELPILKNLAPFIEEFRKMGGVIPLENTIFRDQYQIVLKQLEKKLQNSALEQIEKLYSKKLIGNKEVRARLKHICNFELGLKESKKAGGYVLHIGGGHLSEVCEALEKVGLVRIISTKTLPSGGIHYVMENAFTGKLLEKTVFPKGWTEEKIAQSVWDLYYSDSTVSICDNGKFTKKGIVDGCELKMYWDSSNNNGKIIEEIVTCLPVKE